jgi:transcriptional regulator with XRE-family HTH domain
VRKRIKSVSRYEPVASVPTLDTLMEIADVLKKPATYFLKD